MSLDNPEVFLLRQANLGKNPDGSIKITLPAQKPAKRRIVELCSDIPSVSDIPKEVKVDWLVEGVIPAAQITMYAGDPGSYKSWLLLDLARSVATGQAYLGKASRKIPVVYFDRENPQGVVSERLGILGMRDLGTDLRYWGGWAAEEPPDIFDDRYLKFAVDEKPLMLFDSLIRFHAGKENDTDAMAPVMGRFREMAFAGATVVILHHNSKNGSYRGSTELLAGIDCGISVSIVTVEGEKRISFRSYKNRSGRDFELTVTPNLNEGRFDVAKGLWEENQDRALEQLIEVVTEASDKGITQQSIVKRTKSSIGRNKTIDLLQAGVGKYWNCAKGPGRALIYTTLTDDSLSQDSISYATELSV